MFISHAQNFEDVILWRALKDVNDGFYIDIGAQDPVVDSVSLAFYEQGWRGVHVEPSSVYAEELRKARSDEIVIEALVSNERGEVSFHDIPATGLSTANPDVAARHAAAGYQSVLRSVVSIRLAEILDSYRDREIHWLKIDVEGFEQSVIESWKPSGVRPWIVVLEATSPLSQSPSFEGWEPELLGLGYDFVYFDGLNRFYLSHSQLRLLDMFGPGPHYFDEFQLTKRSPFNAVLTRELDAADHRFLASQAELQRRETEHTAREAALKSELQQRESEHVSRETDLRAQLGIQQEELVRLQNRILEQGAWGESMMRRVEALNAQISDFHRSMSWRITAPLRRVSKSMQRLSMWFRDRNSTVSRRRDMRL